jgi:hypothetical protein
MAKRDPLVDFTDTAEGQVIIAMKQGVIDAVSAIIKARCETGALNASELYSAAIKALDEIEKLQDSLLSANVDADLDTE